MFIPMRNGKLKAHLTVKIYIYMKVQLFWTPYIYLKKKICKASCVGDNIVSVRMIHYFMNLFDD